MPDDDRTFERRLKDFMGFQVWKATENKGLRSEEVIYMLCDQDGNVIDCFRTLPALKKGALNYG